MSASERVLHWPLVVFMMLIVVGCGAAAPAGPVTSTLPGTSPAPSLDVVDIEACDATVMMQAGMVRVHAVKLRQGARARLEQALQSVLTGQDALPQPAPLRMRARIRTLGIAVTNLTLALEDIRTTARIADAAANVRRATTGLDKAIATFRRRLGCDSIVVPPNVAPDGAPDTQASPGPSVEG